MHGNVLALACTKVVLIWTIHVTDDKLAVYPSNIDVKFIVSYSTYTSIMALCCYKHHKKT